MKEKLKNDCMDCRNRQAKKLYEWFYWKKEKNNSVTLPTMWYTSIARDQSNIRMITSSPTVDFFFIVSAIDFSIEGVSTCCATMLSNTVSNCFSGNYFILDLKSFTTWKSLDSKMIRVNWNHSNRLFFSLVFCPLYSKWFVFIFFLIASHLSCSFFSSCLMCKETAPFYRTFKICHRSAFDQSNRNDKMKYDANCFGKPNIT